jgi:CheY-like chemotaxis protein
MSQEQLREIFGEYVTYAGETEEGTGLGLAIVRQLAHLMGGAVSAESDGHSGSVITVWFYQKAEPGQWLAPTEYTRETVLHQAVRWKKGITVKFCYPGARVLLADDMEINRRIFKEQAAPWGFTLDMAEDGEQAVEAARKQRYDLIILDQRMPGIDGMEAARQIRQFSRTPVVIMTAETPDDMREKNPDGEVGDFLEKPLELEQFSAVLEKYLPQELRRRNIPEPTERNRMEPQGEAYGRTLDAYLEEVGALREKLAEYAADDMEMFGTKVHGIKGASRQIGRFSMGESAEVMEMAARMENRAYIGRHLEDFLEELSETLADVREERDNIRIRRELEEENEPPAVEDIWKQLKEGFDSYRIPQIEQALQQLEKQELNREEQELLRQVTEAYQELEYQQGSRLLEERQREKSD